MTWKQGKHHGYPWIYRDARLSNGQKLRLGFSWDMDLGYPWVEVHMCAYRGLFWSRWAFRKQGQAVGPGGVEVWDHLREMFLEGEKELLLRFPSGAVTLAVYAASDRLFKIYRRLLEPHGYWQEEDQLIKYLR